MSHPVKLCIYDMQQQISEKLGIIVPEEKIWHSSVLVFGKEYSYGSDGITIKKPDTTPFSEKDMGYTLMPKAQFEKYVQRLKLAWTSETYSLLYRNCHDFSQLLVLYLDVSDLPQNLRLHPQQLRELGLKLGIESICNSISNFVTKKCESSASKSSISN